MKSRKIWTLAQSSHQSYWKQWDLCLVAQSCLTLSYPMDCSPPASSIHGDSPGKNTGVGCHALLQGIFPTWGSNPGLPYCRRILYHLSHQGSPMSPKELSFESWAWTSVAVQWLRLHWTIQRTQVQSLVWELRSICCQVWLKYKIQSLNYTFESQAFLPDRAVLFSAWSPKW